MPAQRPLPSACAGIALAFALTLAAACRTPASPVLISKAAPDAHHVAAVRLERCAASMPRIRFATTSRSATSA